MVSNDSFPARHRWMARARDPSVHHGCRGVHRTEHSSLIHSLYSLLSSSHRADPPAISSARRPVMAARAARSRVAAHLARPLARSPRPELVRSRHRSHPPRHRYDPWLVPWARRPRGDGATGTTRGARTTTTTGAIVASGGALLLVSPCCSSPRSTEGRRMSPQAIWPEG